MSNHEKCKGDVTDPATNKTEPCDRDAKYRGFCERHYQQDRRGRLGKTRPVAAPGQASEVSFRAHANLKAAAEKLAARMKIEPSEAWREAMRRMIAAEGVKLEAESP